MLSIAILAAGKGTRMKSSLPKVLHKLSGKTLIRRVIDSCIELKPDKIFIVVGHEANRIRESLSNFKDINKINFVLQNPQNGTGHAIQVLSKELKSFKGKLLVLNGDVPLIRSETLKKLIKFHDYSQSEASIITTKKSNPCGYGRVFTDGDTIDKIIEDKDCTPNERLNNLINAGIYCFQWEKLSNVIYQLKDNNIQNEIYLTDTILLLKKSKSFLIDNEQEIYGINNRIQLAKCEEILQKSLKEKHMLKGVTFINPISSSVSEQCEIGMDVVIEANTHIRGYSRISNNCIIGPNSFIEDSSILENSKIINSTVLDSTIMENTCIGPYSHIRPNSKISASSKIGNFVEIKNSVIEKSVKINHLSYIGDSNIGEFTNIGAGTITANFDGIKKHQTNIGANCKIGANSVFIAPVNIENSVTTGAGSIINKNVEKNSLAIARSKQLNIKNWKKNI
tara:strand:+ start:1201 stop:2556 length:1356 start_codon:yes stop_codon:yes gene_type:complete